MRLLICAGGTGGGVYPALAVLEALKAEELDMDVLWVGGEGGMEARLIERVAVPFKTIPAAGVHGVGMRQLPGNLLRLGSGVRHARRILKTFKPDVLFFTGGYVAVPMAIAGMGIPSLLYVPDIEPGLALKTLSAFATRIAVTEEISKQYFRRKARITTSGYPLRAGLSKWSRTDARAALGIRSADPVVLIFGGSKGARSINTAVLAALPGILDTAEIIHITGELDWQSVAAKHAELTPALRDRWHIHPYLHEEMGAALAAANLAVSRAGASSLGEFPLFGLPAILVPYPHAWRYQKVNAEYLSGQGAAVMLEDVALKDGLLPAIQNLLAAPDKLNAMRAAMNGLAKPHAASEIGRLLKSMAGGRR